MNNAVLVDAHYIKGKWDGEKSYKENCSEMFRLVLDRQTNLCFGRDPLNIALVAIALNTPKESEDYEWLTWQLESLKQVNAMLEAAQAGLEVSVPAFDEEKIARLKRDYVLIELFHQVRQGVKDPRQ